MKADLTEEEKNILKGKMSAIASKYGVSHTTVQEICKGNWELNTQLRLDIYNALKETVEFFKPLAQ